MATNYKFVGNSYSSASDWLLPSNSTIIHRMLYWECARRLKELREFRHLATTYYQNRQLVRISGIHENDIAVRTRRDINLRMAEVIRSCLLVGHSLSVSYSALRTREGVVGQLNLVQNMFDLHTYRIPRGRVFDSLDRAIGDYERLERHLHRNIFNPFYWVQIAFTYSLRWPFGILRSVGLNVNEIERSPSGVVIKAVTGIINLGAALATIFTFLHVDWHRMAQWFSRR